MGGGGLKPLPVGRRVGHPSGLLAGAAIPPRQELVQQPEQACTPKGPRAIRHKAA